MDAYPLYIDLLRVKCVASMLNEREILQYSVYYKPA